MSLGRAVRIGGVSTFVVLMLLALVGGARVGDPVGARPRPAPRVRREQRDDRVPRRRVGRVPGARRAAHGLVGRPTPPSTDHRLGQPRVRWLPRALWCWSTNAFQLFWARLGVGVAKSNTYPVQGSLIGDAYPISVARAHQRLAGHGVALRRRAQPGPRRRHRRRLPAATTAGAGPFLLLGVPGRDRGALRVPAAGAAARPVREAGRARRGHRGRAAGADLDRGRVRRGSSRSGRSRPSSSAFAALGFGLFTGPVLSQPLHGGPLRHSTPSTGACSAPSAGSACCWCCPSSGSTTTACTARIPARALRLVGLLILPVGAPHAGPVLHAQRHRCSRSWASRS